MLKPEWFIWAGILLAVVGAAMVTVSYLFRFG